MAEISASATLVPSTIASQAIVPDVAALLELLDMQFEPVAGHHRPAELGVVDGHEIDQRRLVAARSCSRQMAPAVCAIASMISTPGMTGWPGKVALEMRLVDRDVLDADRRIVAVDLDDPVDQQEGIAMRQQRISSRCRPRRASLARSAAMLRLSSISASSKPSQSRQTGGRICVESAAAGEPAQRSPGGNVMHQARPARQAVRHVPIVK